MFGKWRSFNQRGREIDMLYSSDSENEYGWRMIESDNESEESNEFELLKNEKDAAEQLESEFKDAKRIFFDKAYSLNSKIKRFSDLINSPAFQNEINQNKIFGIRQPAFVNATYYFKALGLSRIQSRQSLNAAVEFLDNIDFPTLTHRVLKGECLEKLDQIQAAKEIFKSVEKDLIRAPYAERNTQSYQSCMKRVLDFNARHDLVNEATGLTAREEQEGFKSVKSFTPLSDLKTMQSKSQSTKRQDDRYAVPISNPFNPLRKVP